MTDLATLSSSELSTQADKQVPRLFYVNQGSDAGLAAGKRYPLIPASALELASRAVAPGPTRTLAIDFQAFFAGDLPDTFGANEALLTVKVDTRAPQAGSSDFTAAQVVKFTVGDYKYAGGFESRGAFRNVQFQEWVNLRFSLVELDGKFAEAFTKVTEVIKTSGLASIDVLKGVPYLEVGTKLVEGLIAKFGTNLDDRLWEETPIFSIDPVVNSAYLRDGVYVIADRTSLAEGGKIEFIDGRIEQAEEQLLSTHLIFGCKIATKEPRGR